MGRFDYLLSDPVGYAPKSSGRFDYLLQDPPGLEQAPNPAEDPSFLRSAAAFAARVGLPIIGGVAGGATGLFGAGVGAVPGAAGGAALGGAAGEALGSMIEGREIEPTSVGLAAGLAALPAGPFARAAAAPGLSLARRVALHGLEGAAQGGLAVPAETLVREGRLPTAGEFGTGLAGGAVLGGALGTGLDRALRRADPELLAGLGVLESVRARPVEADLPPVVEAPPVRPEPVPESAVVPAPQERPPVPRYTPEEFEALFQARMAQLKGVSPDETLPPQPLIEKAPTPGPEERPTPPLEGAGQTLEPIVARPPEGQPMAGEGGEATEPVLAETTEYGQRATRAGGEVEAPGPVPRPLDPDATIPPEAGISQPAKVADVSRETLPQPVTEQPTARPIFDGEAALTRLRERGQAQAFDIGGAAAEGAGALRDLAEYGASLIERGVRSFPEWSRQITEALGRTVKNVGQYLRQAWDEAKALLGRAGITFGPLENEPKGPVLGMALGGLQDLGGGAPRPTPAPIRPIPPGAKPGPREPLQAGRATGEPPRVEQKVAALEAESPIAAANLSRNAPRTWESLDPEIRTRLNDTLSDPKREQALYERARSGKLNDVDTMTLDAVVSGKRETADTLRAQWLQAQAAGRTSGPESVGYLKAAMDQAVADLARAARSDVEAGTKLARALAARARIMTAQVSADSPESLMRALFRQIPDITDKQAADLVTLAREKPNLLGDALQQAMKPGMLSKFLEFWKAGLVSAPGTLVGANPLGNLGQQIMKLGETATASLLDIPFGSRTRLRGEAGFELAGGLRGAGKALGQLGRDIKDALTLAPEKIDLSQPFERQVGAIGGKFGRFVRTPFRLLSAFDDFAKASGGEAELSKLAYRQARGDRKAAAALIENPTREMIARVEKSKLERTFQDPIRVANSLNQLRNNHKWLHIPFPFTQTPTSIAAETLRRSPYGFIEASKAYRAYRRAVANGVTGEALETLRGEAIDKLARPLFGTLVMGAFTAYAKAGGMTGSGPTDPKERNLLRDSGWQPYSFKVDLGDGRSAYIPFNRFEPVSSILGFAADIAEAKDAKQSGDLIDKALGSVVQNLTSKTYLQGLADAASVIQDPKQFASQYAANLARSVVPNVVRKGAEAIDPTVRETKVETPGLAGIPERMGKAVLSGLPGATSLLPAKRSATGEEIERPGVGVTRFLSPSQVTADRPERELERVLVDVEANIGAPGRDISIGKGRKVRLTQEEYDLLQDATQKATERLRRTVANPGFRRMDPEAQRRYLMREYDRARDAARSRLKARPDFRRRAMQAQRGG